MPHQCTSCGYLFEDGSKEMLSGCPDCGGNTFQFHPKGSDVPEVPDDTPPEAEGGSVGETVGRATNAVRRRLGSGADSQSSAGGRQDEGTPSTTPTTDTEDHARPPSTTADGTADGPTETPSEPATGSSTDPGDETDFGHDADVEHTDRSESGGGDGSPPASDPEAAPTSSGSEDAAQASARTEFVSPDELPSRAERPTDDERPRPSDGRVVREPTGHRPSLDELREELNEQFESIKIVEPGQYELNLMGLYNREEYVIALQENGRYVIQMPDEWIRNRE